MSESPLRQQIAEAIHNVGPCWRGADGTYICEVEDHEQAADAVVALLNLTEETENGPRWGDCYGCATPRPASTSTSTPRPRCVTPWLPSTPPDTSSSEPA
jgi:hypothetical protein